MNKLNLFTSLSLLLHLLLLISLISPVPVSAECTCDKDEESAVRDRSTALRLKIGALVSILVFGAIGVSLPVLAKVIPAFRPENDFFYIIKSFAAGVILATGFIHVLPDAFENLTSPRLKDHPWGDFSFTGFVAMMTAIGTLMVDTFATGYYRRLHFNKAQPVTGDEEQRGEHAGHVHVHTHATHGHAHGSSLVSDDLGSTDLIRHRVISQVLELGIIVHSVIIGIALGASSNPSEVKTLLVALSFHQFFEGMGLGGCISQAKFKSRAVIIMALFFALTTPVGVAIGIGITTVYDEDSPTALIVEGIFNAASAGILIYMALVDLLAADFMSSRLLNSGKLQLGAYLSLLVGAGCMSLLAKWA